MSALDKLKEQQASTPPLPNSEQLKQIDETLRVLIDTLKSQSERITAIEKAQSDLTRSLNSKPSTSETSELVSLRNGVNEIVKTMNAQSETLRVLGETVSDKRVIKQSDGSSVSASELQAHSMMKQILSGLETTTSNLGELKQTVGNGRTVRIDVNRLSEHAVRVLDERLAQAVEEPVQRVESTLDEVEQRVAAIGTQKAAEAAQAVEEVTGKADELVASVGRAERRLEALEGRMTWTAVGRVCLALVPLFAALILVGGLVWGLGNMFGIGPLFGWAWASFTAASAWWSKALIALGTLGGAAFFVWAVLRVSQWVYEELR